MRPVSNSIKHLATAFLVHGIFKVVENSYHKKNNETEEKKEKNLAQKCVIKK